MNKMYAQFEAKNRPQHFSLAFCRQLLPHYIIAHAFE